MKNRSFFLSLLTLFLGLGQEVGAAALGNFSNGPQQTLEAARARLAQEIAQLLCADLKSDSKKSEAIQKIRSVFNAQDRDDLPSFWGKVFLRALKINPDTVTKNIHFLFELFEGQSDEVKEKIRYGICRSFSSYICFKKSEASQSSISKQSHFEENFNKFEEYFINMIKGAQIDEPELVNIWMDLISNFAEDKHFIQNFDAHAKRVREAVEKEKILDFSFILYCVLFFELNSYSSGFSSEAAIESALPLLINYICKNRSNFINPDLILSAPFFELAYRMEGGNLLKEKVRNALFLYEKAFEEVFQKLSEENGLNEAQKPNIPTMEDIKRMAFWRLMEERFKTEGQNFKNFNILDLISSNIEKLVSLVSLFVCQPESLGNSKEAAIWFENLTSSLWGLDDEKKKFFLQGIIENLTLRGFSVERLPLFLNTVLMNPDWKNIKLKNCIQEVLWKNQNNRIFLESLSGVFGELKELSQNQESIQDVNFCIKLIGGAQICLKTLEESQKLISQEFIDKIKNHLVNFSSPVTSFGSKDNRDKVDAEKITQSVYEVLEKLPEENSEISNEESFKNLNLDNLSLSAKRIIEDTMGQLGSYVMKKNFYEKLNEKHISLQKEIEKKDINEDGKVFLEGVLKGVEKILGDLENHMRKTKGSFLVPKENAATLSILQADSFLQTHQFLLNQAHSQVIFDAKNLGKAIDQPGGDSSNEQVLLIGLENLKETSDHLDRPALWDIGPEENQETPQGKSKSLSIADFLGLQPGQRCHIEALEDGKWLKVSPEIF